MVWACLGELEVPLLQQLVAAEPLLTRSWAEDRPGWHRQQLELKRSLAADRWQSRRSLVVDLVDY